MPPTPEEHLTVPQTARRLGVLAWTVRLAADSLVPPIPRAGLYRIIPVARLEELKAALRRRGHLREDTHAQPA